MGHSTPSGRHRYEVKPSFVGERVFEALTARHPGKTADNVAADLAPWSISRDTIAQMLQRRTAPGAVMMLALIWAYGPDFLAEVHPAPLGWLRPALREQEVADMRRDLAAMQARLERLS